MENIVDENKITDSKHFNMDETSHTVMQRPEKIMSQMSIHQVGANSSHEREKNVTDVYAVNASCFCVPPILIYPRKW